MDNSAPDFVLPSSLNSQQPQSDLPDFTLPSAEKNILQPAQKAMPAARGVLSNEPDESYTSGIAKGAGTAAIAGGSTILGLPGDIGSLANYIGNYVHSKLNGTTMEQEEQKAQAAKDLYEKNKFSWLPDVAKNAIKYITPELPTSSDVANAAFSKTGQYVPTSEMGRIAQAAGTGAVSMLNPLLGGEATLGNLAVGASSGAAGQAAEDVTGSQLAGLAASILVPTAGGLIGQKIAASKTAAADKAANLLHESTTNPEAAISALSKPTGLVPGYTPTTAEATGDVGLAQAQKRAALASPEFAAQEKLKTSQQNTAQRNLLSGSVDTSANPLSVPDFFKNQMDTIDQAHSKVINDLEANAQQQIAAMPDSQTADVIGANFRTALSHAFDARKNLVNHLYDKVPNNLNVVTSGVNDVANAIKNEIDPRFTIPSPHAMPIINMASNLDNVTSLKNLRQLDSTVSSRMAEAKIAGDNIGYRQLTQIKSAIKDSINDAVNNNASVAAHGELQPNMTPEAANALAMANKAYADMAQTYRQNPVAPVLKTNGYKDQFIANNAAVANKIFQSGPAGYENASAFLKASNNAPEAVQSMKDAAILKLYNEMKNSDTLTPQTLATWKSKHADSLRALDEASPGFSSSFDNAATATKALADANEAKMEAIKQAQSGAAGKFLNAASHDEMKAKVGSILSAPDGATQLSNLVTRMKSDPAAIDGLRRAGIEHLMDKFSNAGTDLNNNKIFSGAKLNLFLRNHSNAAEALFGPEVVNNMRAIAADADRTSRMLTASASRNGSDTAKNLIDFMKSAENSNTGHSFWSYLASGATSTPLLTSLAIHHPTLYATLSPLIGIGRYINDRITTAGIKKTHDLLMQGLLDPEIGKVMIQNAIDKKGKPNVASIRNITNVIAKKLPTAAIVEQGREQINRASGGRTGRAAGGKVGFDHEAKADKLILLADKIKKDEAKKTSSILNVDDSTVAQALAVVNRKI